MKQSGKKLLWRGLSGVACFSLCFSMIAGVALETNAGTIDTYLGTHSEVLTSENNEENPLYDKFNPPAELLNEDGTGNSKALITAAMDLGRREVAEGSVLLKNNGALPLASGSNVTLLGIRSHKNLLGSNFGVGAKGVYVSLEQALSQNRTDFAHTIVSTLGSGSYYFAVGNGAHDALNNIMAAQGMDAEKMVGTGDASKVFVKEITEDFISKTLFSVSKTGYKISNQLPYADWNYYQPGEVTYLTRTDWAGTFPKHYGDMTLTNEQLIKNLNGETYTLKTDDDTSDILWGQDNGIQFYEMFGVPYDDPKWDKLLDQLTLEEAMYIFSFGGPTIPGAESIGTVETYMTENAGNGVAVNLNASKDPNAPWAIPATDPNGNWHPQVFANAPIGASTFNPALMRELGEFTGIESLFTGINILWGPGLNTHRHAYNGRNGEYYSEDPILSGVAAMEFSIGALNYGLVAAPKHFAFNDQETERGGISPYMTEQRARELELRAYQYAFEATKYDTPEYNAGMRGLMTSFSKIGSVECTTSEGLMTEILANEWGFIGYAVTDIYDDVDLWSAVLNSGTTCFDTRGESGFYGVTTLSSSFLFQNLIEGKVLDAHFIDGDANLQRKLKEAVHKNIYAWTESHLMNRYNATTHIQDQMTWWRATYYAGIGVSGVVLVLSAAMYVLSGKRKKEEE